MERMLVVMPNWFGETLFATPFLRALRAASPRAFVAALGVPRCAEVLAHNPDLQETMLFDEQGVHRPLSAKTRLIAALRRRRFDAAFILRRSLSRTMMLALAGIPRRVGFANWKSGWLLTHRVQAPPASTHKAAAYLRLLEPCGIKGACGSYRFYPSEEERAQAAALLRDQGLLNGRPIVVLHPGANWAHKRWLAERFARLADRLAQAGACSIVVTGSPEDQALTHAIRDRMAAPASLLAGRTTLRQLAACLEHASLVVSNDTGVLHVASALGRPVVALYGPTSPAITGPLGDSKRTIVIHHPDCCPRVPCDQPEHPRYPGMASISVEEVFDAARHMLEAGSRKYEVGGQR